MMSPTTSRPAKPPTPTSKLSPTMQKLVDRMAAGDKLSELASGWFIAGHCVNQIAASALKRGLIALNSGSITDFERVYVLTPAGLAAATPTSATNEDNASPDTFTPNERAFLRNVWTERQSIVYSESIGFGDAMRSLNKRHYIRLTIGGLAVITEKGRKVVRQWNTQIASPPSDMPAPVQVSDLLFAGDGDDARAVSSEPVTDGIDDDTVRLEVKRVTDEYGTTNTVIHVYDKDGYAGGASGHTFAQAVDSLARMFGVQTGSAS